MKCDGLRQDPFSLAHKRVLIIKPSSLGDIVHTVPVVHALKRCYPTVEIGWVIQKQFVQLIEADLDIDEIIPISIPSTSDPGAGAGVFVKAAMATFTVMKKLRSHFSNKPYDYILDLHASLRSGLIGICNPGGMRIGFSDAKEFNTRFQHYLAQPRPEFPHAVDKNLLFAEQFGCEPIPADFMLRVAAQDTATAQSFVAKAGIGSGPKIVYANPATRWAAKFWIDQYWAELADMIIRELNATVVFAGAPTDIDLIGRIIDQMMEQPLVSAGKLNLRQSTALLKLSDIYVGVDSGPMHIAAFTGTPVVAIFGPTDPAKVGPYGKNHIVLRNNSLDCIACRKRECSKMACMKGITPETVFAAVRRKLTEKEKCSELN